MFDPRDGLCFGQRLGLDVSQGALELQQQAPEIGGQPLAQAGGGAGGARWARPIAEAVGFFVMQGDSRDLQRRKLARLFAKRAPVGQQTREAG